MTLYIYLFKVIVSLLALIGLTCMWNMIGREIHDKQSVNYKVQADLAVLENALIRFQADSGHMPSDDEGLNALIKHNPHHGCRSQNIKNSYLESLPSDTRGYPYSCHRSASQLDTYFTCFEHANKNHTNCKKVIIEM